MALDVFGCKCELDDELSFPTFTGEPSYRKLIQEV
jgi:hypothetical protein